MTKKHFDLLFTDVAWALYHLIFKVPSAKIQQKLKKAVETLFLTLGELYPKDKYSIDYSLGVLYCHSAPPRFKESEKRLKSALRLSKNNHQKAKALNALGTLYYEQKEYQKALALYRRALKMAKHKSVPLYNIAFTYEKMGNKKEAAKIAGASIKEMEKETDLKHSTDPQKTLRVLIKRCRQ